MSVSDLDVKGLYQADGGTDTFAIPFAFVPAQASNLIKVYLIAEDGVESLQSEGLGADYVLDPAYDPVTNPDGPTNVVFNTAPSSDYTVLVIRESPLTQDVGFVSNSPIPPKTVETGLDKLLMKIQELAEKFTRTFIVGHLPPGFTTHLGFPIAGYVPRVKEDGTGLEFVSPETLASVGGGGVPPGGGLGDYIEKSSATDGDAAWVSGTFAGYSLRYNQLLNLVGLRAALLWIFNFGYTLPGISLSATGSSTVREKGDTVSSTTLTATLTRTTDPLQEVRFYQSASTLLDTQATGPDSGTETYTYSTPFSDTVSFYAQVDDNGTSNAATPQTSQSNVVTFTFVYPYYFGEGAAGLTASQVAALTKDIRTSNANLTKTFSPDGSEVLYFAYPASYGDLTAIYDVNNFDTISDWTKRAENITGLDSNAVSYNIYEFNNVPLAGSYDYRFVR